MKINLGSGQQNLEGYVNIDNRKEVNPDLCCDIVEGIPIDDNSVDYVRAFDVLEHIPIGKTIKAIEEIYRVMKHGAIFESYTPDAQFGLGAFQDPFHVSFWVKNSWLYYSEDVFRTLYGIKAKFRIDEITRIPVEITSVDDIVHLHVIAVAIKE